MSIQQHAPQVVSSQRGVKKYLSLGLAVLTCPCHAPLLVGDEQCCLGTVAKAIKYARALQEQGLL